MIKIEIPTWTPSLKSQQQVQYTNDLELGQVLFFPDLSFPLLDVEQAWMAQNTAEMKAKNISYNVTTHLLKGIECESTTALMLQGLCQRFQEDALSLILSIFPYYQSHLHTAMTSFRPIEVAGRIPASPKKDDTRLHVDAFPSRPNQGRRILRIFSNINPSGKNRVWRVGEPFENVARRFFPQVKMPLSGSAALMRALSITKGYRTRYDSAMLQIHDKMKADLAYQAAVPFQEISFPAGSTWVVFSDSVSHAVLSGQHMMEQTFYLPPQAMQNAELSPLSILEKLAHRPLI